MDELEKLIVMLRCRIKHNNEHAKIYMYWAGKVSFIGNEELSMACEAFYGSKKTE
jgi:hypothetical protein